MYDIWKGVLTDTVKKERYKKYVESWEKKIGAFLEFNPEHSGNITEETGSLSGMPFAVKDIIAVKGFKLTCGSKILSNLISPYTATAVKKLQDAGAVVVGKTNLDEFGMGSSTDNSALGKTSNPWDTSRVAGGSSGGSAAAVAAGLVPFALGSDTGGSVRQPASFCGIYGLKPTYGVVSRYGLTAYASSLDVIGIHSGSISLLEEVFNTIKDIDSMDHSSIEYTPSGKKSLKRVGVLKGPLEINSEVAETYRQTINNFKDLGFDVTEINLNTFDYVVPAYYTIATAEASANLARFNGIKYGQRAEYAENPDELVRISRVNGFGDEVKLRILLGTYVLRSGFHDQYYLRAQKIRTAIRNDFNRIFKNVDLILMPVYPTQAFKHGKEGLDPFQQKLADKFTCSANLAGIPALSFPAAVKNGLPVGMQLLSPAFEEKWIFEAASLYRQKYTPENPSGYSMKWR